MCSNDPGNVKKYTSPEEFFRDHDPTQLVSRESKEVETAIQIAEQAVVVCAAYVEEDKGLGYVYNNYKKEFYLPEDNFNGAQTAVHKLYARHLYHRHMIEYNYQKETDSHLFSLTLCSPFKMNSTINDANIPCLVRFLLNTYLIRETKKFKEKWERMDYIMKHSYGTHLYEHIWNNFWYIINNVVDEIYQQNTSHYNAVDSYQKNFHPFQKDEFDDFTHKIGGRGQLKALLPKCTWLTQGDMDAGCDSQQGFSGILRNGRANFYSRTPSQLWNITSTINGKRNYNNRVNIQHLFYRMLVGPIEAKNTLQKKPDGSCTKGNTTSVCFNPFCFYQVKRGVKRKWRPTTDKEKEDFAAFLTVHPGIADWVDF